MTNRGEIAAPLEMTKPREIASQARDDETAGRLLHQLAMTNPWGDTVPIGVSLRTLVMTDSCGQFRR